MKKKHFISLVIINLCLTLFFYHKNIFQPNEYLFNNQGDCIKNYYVYISHIKNDTGFLNTSALNYPYGESIFFTDCHPFFSTVLKILNEISQIFGENSIAFINLLMLFSMFISAIILFKIFELLSTNKWYAVLSATALAWLSPQIFRILGHPSLSYSFVIPLGIYFLLKLENTERKELKWKIYYIILTFIALLTHTYLGFFLIMFSFLFYLIKTISEKEKKERIQNSLKLFFLSILPALVFLILIKMLDKHTGRTSNPYGFLLFNSSFSSVFLPIYPPMNKILTNYFNFTKQEWEGWAYIGMVNVLGIILFLFIALRNSYLQGRIVFFNRFIPDKNIRYAIIASIVILLFSMGFPFIFYPPLKEWFPMIKQFRGTGRFAWVFYYVAGISIFYFFGNILKDALERKRKFLYWFLFFIFPLFTLNEGLAYHQEISKSTSKSENLFLEKNFRKNEIAKNLVKKIDANKYQAIIPIPFYAIGSDNVGKGGSDKIFNWSMVLAFHLRLPLLAGHSTRSSIWETRNLMQVFSPEFYEKNIKKDIMSEKPFLLVYSKEGIQNFEQNILNKATLLFASEEIQLLEISFGNLLEYNTKKSIKEFYQIKDSLFKKNNFLVSDTSSFLYFNQYNNLPAKVSLSNGGALESPIKIYTHLADFKERTFKPNIEYEASFWMYHSGENYG